jgi:predicted RNA-binding Zn ribbon-like protein
MATLDESNRDGDSIFKSRMETCLDFANTLTYRGSNPAESLHGAADLLKWCEDAGAVPSALAPQVRSWFDRHPKRAFDIFGEAIALREVIYRIFHSIASGATPDEGDLDLLNRALQDAPPRVSLESIGGAFGWKVEEAKPSSSWILAAVLWSAGDLLVGPQLSKLRECSNEKCLWLFLDDSKNGTRRWCSMQSCGNRAKAHRHYLRQKQA